MSVRRANTVVSVIVLLALLIQPLASVAAAPQPGTADWRVLAPDQPEQGFLFRASVRLEGSRNLARLQKAGVQVLQTVDANGKQSALVLVDGEQLADLARLGFQPRAADELRLLANGQGPEKRWLAQSLQPLLAQADVIVAQQAPAGVARAAAAPDTGGLQVLRASIKALTPTQLAGVAGSASIDDDADGLTNTQESWWCTDPLNPDTDSDGRSDGAEIQALKDWMANKRAGPPGETPWPSWPFNSTSCPDKDHDSIPNLAERWELGLNMDLESSDRDRYDDGQELIGTTYCPGSGNACGYGQLPSANHDGILLFPQMPAWVTAPGNHPLVAAYPRVEVDIVPGEGGATFKMVATTIVTTDKRVEEGEAKSYSTTKTEGTSTSNAETETWEEWQEVSKTTEASVQAVRTDLNPSFAKPTGDVIKINNRSTQVIQTTNVATTSLVKNVFNVAKTANPVAGYGVEKATQAADFILSEACAEVQCKKYAGAAVKATVRTAVQSFDAVQKAISSNQCGTGILNQVKCAAQAVGTTFANNWSKTFDARLQEATLAEQEARGQVGGATMTRDGNSLDVRTVYPVTYPAPAFVPTETHTSGSSKGGAHTTTHTQYEEHAITEGTTKQFGKSWGTATAENSAHAADLWFAYEIRNVGADYARVICNLAFNIYIGSDPLPAATYYPGADLGGDGCFSNFRPGEAHKFTFPSAKRINLTLEQMKTVDLGGPVRIVVEDLSLGQDDFYTDDAVKGGITVSIEDGPEDGDDLVNSYVIPTWGAETVLDVLTRYFPHETDETGLVVTVWTPEYRADAPTWCLAPQRVGTTLWCKHAMSTADWWSIYLNGLGDGSEGFQDTPAAPDTVVVFRFNSDSDIDGYSDRTELRLGTDPEDPISTPKPELIAGVSSIKSGSDVVATLSLLNTGLYDAYGVEAVMIAPNDTISITNNTVGGSGRVRAQKQVIVGSRIVPQTPLPAAWLVAAHAQPAAGGYYTGTTDLTYTFTAADSGSVGIGTLRLNWNDGAGGSGVLNFGAGYKSPTLLDVSNGVKLGLLSGTLNTGETFTVAARTPRDTFQYTIAAGHESDFTPPVVLVSYNDPQGNHRFGIPPAAMALASPTDNLLAYSGQMQQEPGVEIVTTAAHSAGANTTNLVVNNATGVTLTNAHLFMEFVNITGTVTSEVPVLTTLPPGPNVVPVAWNTAAFSPAYDPAQDYIVMAFLTDTQGNILDTAARPLSSFQEDPKPAFTMSSADETWDFGTAQQGTLLQRTFTLGSVGHMNLLTYLGTTSGMSVAGPTAHSLPPGDTATYTVTLNTQVLPVGAFEQTIPVRTSDPEHPEKTITIRGDVTAMPPDASGGATLRPLDWPMPVSGPHSAGEWITYTHTLMPVPETLQPVRVFSQDYSKLWGVGKYATPFGQGTASADMFGDGHDGPLTIADNTTDDPIDSLCSGISGSNVLAASNTRFAQGQTILIHQTQGANAGTWMLNKIVGMTAGTITLADPLNDNYTSGAQVLALKQYTNVTVNPGKTWTAKAWNGKVGGILGFLANGTVTNNGNITATGKGFRSGAIGQNNDGTVGENYSGLQPAQTASYYGGGGAGINNHSGGGGGYGTAGAAGDGGSGGGSAYGTNDFASIFFGGGGGGFSYGGVQPDGDPSNGGGIILIAAMTIDTSGGYIYSKGSFMAYQLGTQILSGLGAGGSILIRAQTAILGTNLIDASAGSLDPNFVNNNIHTPGAGGVGRIHVEYCNTYAGTTNPPVDPRKLNCYVVEQVESSPHTQARLNLPESFTDSRIYEVQYGRRYVFAGAGQSTQFIRMPRQLYSTATLDALVSNTGVTSGPLTLSLDTGNDGTPDWTYSNAATSFPAALNATGLASALNAYMVAQTSVAWGADVDMPVRVQIDRQADVILTNLVLTLQSNQPGALAAAAVEMGADRPLDVPVVITGNHNQGEAYDFTHALGPNADSIQPCKLYSQDGSAVKGVGKYCSDFGSGSMPYSMFGDGRDGDLLVGSGQITTINTTRVNATASGSSAAPANSTGFVVGDAVLFHQTQGTANVGRWEFNQITAINSATSWTLAKSLSYNYDNINGRAQAIRVPQYHNITVQSGGALTAPAWDGSLGGVITFRGNGTLMVESGAGIDISGRGFRGGTGQGVPGGGQNGESTDGFVGSGGTSGGGMGSYGGGSGANNGSRSPAGPRAGGAGSGGYNYPNDGQGDEGTGGGGGGGHATAGGGGGGGGDSNTEGGAGGGAGSAAGGGNGGNQSTNGGNGGDSPRGYTGSGGDSNGSSNRGTGGGGGGSSTGDDSGTSILFGSGGGASGAYQGKNAGHHVGRNGGNGGGVAIISVASIQTSGTVATNGQTGGYTDGRAGSAGGGAGGGIIIQGRQVVAGSSQIQAIGGNGGPPSGAAGGGGQGGAGRIRVEYCDTISGFTNPAASTAKLNCYAAEQVYESPYTKTRLYLPESFTDGRTYQMQYGRRYTFAAAAQDTKSLSIKRQVYSAASLDALVSNTGVASGSLNLCLDIGNDTICDFTHNASTTFPATLTATTFANALNTYLLSRTDVAWGQPVDVPVRVQVDRAADVMLTNLALTPVGAKTRFLRLPARTYDSVALGIQFGTTGTPAGPLAFTVDVGADGTVDFSYSGTPASYPAVIATGNVTVTNAFNAYLAGRSGDVDVPIRITPSPSLDTTLYSFTAAPSARPDVTLSSGDIGFSAGSPTEGDGVTVNVTLHNSGSRDTGPLTASFVATPAGGGAVYIGSAFVDNIPPGDSKPAHIPWNTLGFTGNVAVRVTVDPFNRVAESDETNNQATSSLTVRTRPDLSIPVIALADPEPTAGEVVTVTLTVSNTGQTAAGEQTVALYDGNPDASGTIIGAGGITTLPTGATVVTFTWTATTPGVHRLFARADRDRQVNEYDEGNNDRWRDVYVGFRSPILLDGGAAAADPTYSAALGYGAVDEGQPDEAGACGAEPWQTFRRDPGGRAVYRFDHLLPGHFYHLDLSLYLCGQAARDETVAVDGNVVAGPEHLGDGQLHRLSLRLDPALYADRTISVTVESAGLGGAIVNEVALHDVDYRYSDGGGTNDPPYTAGRSYGYLNGVPRTQWGTLPSRSLRENQSGNSVSYRYDGLLQSKRYQAFMSFWQNAGSPVTQKVQINGVDTGTALTIQSGTPYSATINVPTSYYVGGAITVTAVRTDATTSAMVNEIALEERTRLNLPAIRDVRVTNVGDTTASVSWISADPADGQTHYGPTAALGAIGQDERGPTTVSRTHQVTLLDLSPQTSYQFYVTSADSVGTATGGALYQFATGPTLSLPASDMIYGQVFNPDNSPAAGALVYVTLRDADGHDNPGTAAPLSALVDAGGYWSLNLGGARTADNATPFGYDPATDRLDISATLGTGCAANLTIHPADASPAPPMTLACSTQVPIPLAAGWNLIGSTVRTEPATAAETALDDIVAQGGSASEIERWWNGGWDAHVRDLPFNNFALELGRGYFIRTGSASVWTRTGTPPSSPLPVELYPGWNLISIPKLTCSPLAENVLVAIAAQGGACGEIDRWYAGNWQGHIKGLSFNNFAIATDQGYFVKCTQRSTYIPCQGTAQSAGTAWPPGVEPPAMTPEPSPTIGEVQVTNRRDVAFTVTWRTDRPSTGWVAYGTDGKLDKTAHDDRGKETVSTLHHVTLTGLIPETAYALRLHSGQSVAGQSEPPYRITTAATLTPTVPLIAYGHVLDAAGQPAVGALVRAQIDGAASAASEPLSALVDGWGYWTLSLPAEDCSDKTLSVETLGPDGTVARMTQPACAVQPAPALTLGVGTRSRLYLPLVLR